ncbi:hypothetical protein TorRG33x02_175280 [Trema orientale]|uniref:Rx N-terminal domain-containing protein n=1 Tax=Trema orientale TaxID=63057 RepID=A0A2P5EMD4_TREOI|nr:hypothetical protein TorRG33x02_175280 [Trema orientale]
MSGSLLSVLLEVLSDMLAFQYGVLGSLKFNHMPAKYELKLMLVSANKLLNYAKNQLKEPNGKAWLERLEQVLQEVDCLMNENNTQALSRKAPKHNYKFSRTQFTPINNTLEFKIKEMGGRLELLLRQREFLSLKLVDPKLPSGCHWYTIEGRFGLVYKLGEHMLDYLEGLASNIDDVAHSGDDDDSAPTWNNINRSNFSSDRISFFSDDIED